MGQTISRRSVAKGALWSVPAVTVATAAPAMAASCTPTATAASASATWLSHQTGYTSINGGDPELHSVQYTFTNNGPDPIPAGISMKAKITIVVLQGEDSEVKVQQTSGNVSANATNDLTNDDDAGTTTDVATVTMKTTATIPVNGTFVVDVLATYGAVNTAGDVAATEEVTVETPQVVTDESTCVTTTATVDITGGSDGTSYTSP